MRSTGQKLTDIENLKGQHANLFTRMENASVKLTGGTFVGSGVLLATTSSGGNTFVAVATAAHNLYIYIDGLSGQVKAPFWEDKLSDLDMSSEERLQLLNTKKDAIINQVTKGTVSPFRMEFPGLPDMQVRRVVMGDWTRDLCLLLGKEPTNTQANYAASAIYQSAGDLAYWEAVSNQLNMNKTLPQGYRLIQSGYGQKTLENENSKEFQFKVSSLATTDGGWEQEYYDSNLGTNSEVILLQSRADWTTLPGDSGGPLFAVHPQQGRIAVIGVTLGADVFKTREAETDALAVDDNDGAYNNACTSLSSLYYAWPYGTNAKFAAPLFGAQFTF